MDQEVCGEEAGDDEEALKFACTGRAEEEAGGDEGVASTGAEEETEAGGEPGGEGEVCVFLPCNVAEDGGAENEGGCSEEAKGDAVTAGHPGEEAKEDGEVFEVDELDDVGVAGEPPLAHVEHDGHVGLGVEADALVIGDLLLLHVVTGCGHVVHGAVVFEDGEHEVWDEDEEDGDGPDVSPAEAREFDFAPGEGEAEDGLEEGEGDEAFEGEAAEGAEEEEAEGG